MYLMSVTSLPIYCAGLCCTILCGGCTIQYNTLALLRTYSSTVENAEERGLGRGIREVHT